MKTLLERLKPEFKKQINDFWNGYDSSIELIEKELSSCYYYNDLKYGTIKEIYWACFGVFKDVNEAELNEMFTKLRRHDYKEKI